MGCSRARPTIKMRDSAHTTRDTPQRGCSSFRAPRPALVSLGLRLALGWLVVVSACQRRAAVRNGTAPANADRQVLARIGQAPIYADVFQRQLQRLQLPADESGSMPPATGQAQKKALLADLIDRQLLLQEADRLQVHVQHEAVEAAYKKVHSGWAEPDLNSLLQAKDVTAAELKQELREQLLVRRYVRDYVAARVAVTDAEIDAYAAHTPQVLQAPQQVHAYHLVVQSQETADELVKKIHGGLRFEEAAMKYSLSPEGKNGGDLGFFEAGVLPKFFDEVCFSLPLKTLSKVVPSAYGYHLFTVLERRPAAAVPLSAQRDKIESILRRDKERLALQTTLKELRARTPVHVDEVRFASIR
jgi:peptidyl-prolyl cis-trans isomerase C